jgi:hypothetical protein
MNKPESNTAGRELCYECMDRFGAKVPNVPVGTVYGGRCYLCGNACNAAIAAEGYIWPENRMPTRDGGWREIAHYEPRDVPVPSSMGWTVLRGAKNG